MKVEFILCTEGTSEECDFSDARNIIMSINIKQEEKYTNEYGYETNKEMSYSFLFGKEEKGHENDIRMFGLDIKSKIPENVMGMIIEGNRDKLEDWEREALED